MEIVANLVGYTTNLAALIRRPMQELGSNSVLLRHSPTRLTREEASRFELQDDLKLYTPGELCTTCLTDGCVLTGLSLCGGSAIAYSRQVVMVKHYPMDFRAGPSNSAGRQSLCARADHESETGEDSRGMLMMNPQGGAMGTRYRQRGFFFLFNKRALDVSEE